MHEDIATELAERHRHQLMNLGSFHKIFPIELAPMTQEQMIRFQKTEEDEIIEEEGGQSIKQSKKNKT